MLPKTVYSLLFALATLHAAHAKIVGISFGNGVSIKRKNSNDFETGGHFNIMRKANGHQTSKDTAGMAQGMRFFTVFADKTAEGEKQVIADCELVGQMKSDAARFTFGSVDGKGIMPELDKCNCHDGLGIICAIQGESDSVKARIACGGGSGSDKKCFE